MLTLKFKVTGQIISLPNPPRLINNSEEYLYANFTFTPDWQDSLKTIFFYRANPDGMLIRNRYLNNEGTCQVPAQILNGDGCYLTVLGTAKLGQGNKVITTNSYRLRFGANGMPMELTPDMDVENVWGQGLAEALKKIDDHTEVVIAKVDAEGKLNIEALTAETVKDLKKLDEQTVKNMALIDKKGTENVGYVKKATEDSITEIRKKTGDALAEIETAAGNASGENVEKVNVAGAANVELVRVAKEEALNQIRPEVNIAKEYAKNAESSAISADEDATLAHTSATKSKNSAISSQLWAESIYSPDGQETSKSSKSWSEESRIFSETSSQYAKQALDSAGDAKNEADKAKIIADKLGRVIEGIITLSNIETYPFNNSQQTIALSERLTNNYVVLTEITKAEGNAGNIETSERLNNGFKIKYTGSASSVTVKYKVLGGE